MKHSDLSLRKDLLIKFLLAAVLPVLVFGLGVAFYYNSNLVESIQGSVYKRATRIKFEVIKFLDDSLRAMNMTRDLILTGDHSNLPTEQVLNSAVANADIFEALYLVNDKGRIVDIGLPESRRQLRQSLLGIDFPLGGIFRGVVSQTEEFFWSDTYVSLLTGEPSIFATISVGRQKLVGSISLDKIGDYVFRNLEDDFGEVGVVDRHGTLVAHTDRRLARQRVNLNFHPEVVLALKERRDVTRHFDKKNRDFFGISFIPETGWAAYSSRNYSLAMKPVRGVRHSLIAIIVFSVLLAGFAAMGLAQRVLRPLTSLTSYVRKVADGEFNIEPLNTRYGEVNTLTGEFHKMCHALLDREGALRQSEERYRGLINSIDGIVWEFDIEHFRFTFVSPAAESILGFPVDEWYQEGFWQEHIHPDDRETAMAYCIDQTDQGLDHQFDYRMIGKDGRVVWIHDLVSVQSDQGKPTGLSGVMIDVTEEMAIRSELDESQQRFALAKRLTGTGLWDYDFRTRRLYWSSEHYTVFGADPDSFDGTLENALRRILPEDRARVDAEMEEGAKGGHMISSDFRVAGDDGQIRWVHTVGNVIYDDSGEPVRMIGLVQDVSEKKAIEQSLIESEEKYRSLIDTMAEGLMLLDLNGVIIECNPSAISILELNSRDRMIGKNLWREPPEFFRTNMQAIPAEEWPDLSSFYQGTSIEGLVLGVRNFAGKLVWLRINAEMFATDLTETGTALLVTFADISDFVLAEQSLRNTIETFSALVTAAPLAIMTTNPLGQITAWNDAAEEQFDQERSDILGQSYPDLGLYMEGSSSEEFNWQHGTDILRGHELLQRKKDGSYANIRLYRAPLFDEKKVFLGLVGIIEDVTESKTIQQQLEINEERFRLLFEEFQALLNGIPDAIMLLSTDRRLIWANEVANRMLLDTCEQNPEQCSCEQFCVSREKDCEKCPVSMSLKSIRLEEALIEGPGEKMLGVKAFPLTNEFGTANRVIVIASDVTEKTLLREEAERAGRLASLGELSAGIAHEINNPTGLLLMNLPLLRDALNDAMPILEDYSKEHGDFFFGGIRFSRMSSQILSIMDESFNSARRIRGIVEDLKRFARSNDQDDLERVEINQAVKQSIKLVTVKINKSTNRFACNFAEHIPPVMANSLRIEQVLINLLVNATQALTDKSKGIEVKTLFDESDGQVKVVVKDEGCGIKPEDLKRISDPFYTTKRSRGGTGLGLSVSSRIVRELNGRLDFESTLGEGTKVTFSLPAMEMRNNNE